jgi:hypothetical protein
MVISLVQTREDQNFPFSIFQFGNPTQFPVCPYFKSEGIFTPTQIPIWFQWQLLFYFFIVNPLASGMGSLVWIFSEFPKKIIQFIDQFFSLMCSN